ncbi:cilia- and flagella-associated protein 144-like [Paralichthys olivaceus]|uniref:cilia- and flagella-associated protein 144-like n=1 Tax=Paralichthys olivaceus TaxID=8255 RepID=UPI00097DB581|nr:PREDICTED: protein FAM183B-like [Paralichthys olivaceus]
MSKRIAENKEKNQVHQDAIHVENIRKEQRNQTVHTEFSINPFKKLHVLTDKPTDPKPTYVTENKLEFSEALRRARRVPKEKYPRPQTESQEIGWRLDPLIPMDSLRERFNFHRKRTDITKNK